MTGLYIHVPFCLQKCPYCAFYSLKYCEERKNAYVSALIRNIQSYSSRAIPCDTIYFGGGTPSLLSCDDVKMILDAVRQSFCLASDSEITMEANPSSVTPQKLEGYLNCGVNRISFGVQSCHDEELKALGRLHDFDGASKAVSSAREAGFKNISCDLMIGTPGQTLESLINSAERIAELGVEHISCYMLKIEEGTDYDCEWARKEAADDDLMADMYLALCSKLSELGYDRYEISNFAKGDFISRHNMKYWQGEEYIGFGPSAHSFFGGKRFYVPDDLDDFIADPLQTELSEDEHPDPLEEYVMLSLRIKSGISFERLSELGGNAYYVKRTAEPFEKAGLLVCKKDRIYLTDKGALLSNSIITELYMAAIGENQ